MKITVPYGEEPLQINVPDKNIAWVIDRRSTERLSEPESKLKGMLRKPTAGPPLKELAKGSKNGVVLVDDNTRPTPAHVIVPAILDELNESGVRDRDIEIIIALGTHRKMNDEEIEKKLGSAKGRVRVRNFDCHDESDLIEIGKTSLGFEIVVSKRVYSADLIIGVGNIVPHCYAGWAGGGKIIQPGVCGVKTIEGTHILAGKIKPISSIVGNLDQPARKLIDEIAVKAGLKFIVNTVLNEKDEIVDMFVGEPLEAFRKGVKMAAQIYCPKIPELADIVLVSSYPADLEYWQASKPVDYACLGAKKGGTIILLTPCTEGIATMHPELGKLGCMGFQAVCDAYDEGEIEDRIAAGALMLHSQIREHAEVICVSHGLTMEDKQSLGFTHAETIDDALQLAFSKHGGNARIGIMKCGDIMPTLNK